MPFNIESKKYYDYNYKAVYNQIISSEQYKKISHFVEQWIQVLYTIDNERPYENAQKEIDYFQFKLYTNYGTYLFHFNISRILPVIKQLGLNVIDIDSNCFGVVDKRIVYQKEDYNIHHEESKDPIIICRFPILKSEYIVIDGNHRTSAKIKKQKYIKAFLYNPINQMDFLYKIDWAMYLFTTEIYNFGRSISEGMPIDNLFRQSYLYNIFNDIII